MNHKEELSISLVRESLRIATEALSNLDDKMAVESLLDGSLNEFLLAIAHPDWRHEFDTVQDFLLHYKNRLTLLSQIRFAITENYTIKGVSEGADAFVFVTPQQWFEDGVMYNVGSSPDTGRLALYQNGEVSFAVTARDIRAGDEILPTDFEWIHVQHAREIQGKLIEERTTPLETPLRKLEALLESSVNDESKYQEVLQTHSWVLGGNYSQIVRHEKLDDLNIPDFTGIRMSDNCRDIIEIKPPFTKLFRADNKPNAAFNEYYNQTARYLDFVKRNEDYLYKKGLRFENPQCYLILGYNLNDEQIRELRLIERNNPAIHIMTYDFLLRWVIGTIQFMRERSDSEKLMARD